ncbi:interphotoreceptor matrix proteoglycan 2 [Pleuronectes platessa]|uniref:interphotoreceptor matrix proteoglycan 2 n=1 Tax=Pleuronectes platessa TaxID=8262 RepID=UPI00232A23FF|nr:interphotoreceptor matrix proteoglycan 2 [Pleuronectes platessa]
MSFVSWKCVFYPVAFSFLVIFLDIRTGATLEGSSMGQLSLPYSQEPVAFPNIVRVSDVNASREGHAVVSRKKRNILYPSGVKLCAQETAQQVVSSHLSYFHLRVCQETVWEAFKIFWDRLPEQEEYQSWMSQCQEGTVTAQNVGSYFSQSEEHETLVKKRISRPGVRSESTRSWQNICSTPAPDTSEAPQPAKGEEVVVVVVDAVTNAPDVKESTLDNDIAVQPPTPAMLEQVVELSILLTRQAYSSDLKDPASLQFQTLSRQLAEKIAEALEGLPGFKSVSVLDFRSQKDSQGLDGVVVDYAVTVAVDAAGVSNEQLDYLTLQSNRVENSYQEVKERPTVVHTISEVKNFVTEALQNNELEAVSEIPESVSAADGVMAVVVDEPQEIMILEEDMEDVDLPEPSETFTASTAGNDVTFLEESAVVSAAPVLVTSALETDSMEEEGLLLEDTVQAPAVENPPPEELPDELPSTELPEDVTLPEPPMEIEASGSDLEVSLQPTQALEDLEIPEETIPESSTIVTEITEEESLPALVPPPEAVDGAGEAAEPESAETGLFSLDGESVEVITESLTVEESVNEDHGLEEAAAEREGQEVKVELETPETPVVENEATGAPSISTEDLTEDEVLLVNMDEEERHGLDSLNPAQPTALSPEKESPFTRVSDVNPASEGLPDIFIPSLVEIQTSIEGLDDATIGEPGVDVVHYGYGLINHTEEGSTGFPFDVAYGSDQVSIAMPANPGRALMVFFSLRVTNMIFSDDLFNKNSPEYKALEQRFLELLVPYLQSNLTNFENLEILNFRNGSIVVNSRMKFGKPVAQAVTSSVYLILEDFCNTAYQTMNLAIDKYSLDVESGDQADPCKFQACNEYAECKVNKWSGEAECVCNAGYFSVADLPCQSICDLQTDFCLNDGKCDIIPGQGAICRCRVGENWWYRGEHCEEYVSEPLVVGIAIASVAGFLLVASGVIFFLARTLRDQYDKDESEDPIRGAESLPSLERATKYNPMYESEVTTGYSHYYRRYPEYPVHSSASAEASTDFSSEEIRHIYENSELTKEEIQDRIRIIELYAKDRQFADFVRQHQAVIDTRNESSTSQT